MNNSNNLVYVNKSQNIEGTKTFSNAIQIGSTSSNGRYGRSSIEFKPESDNNFGGFIDFHYAGDTSDYTSRLIEDASGKISYTGSQSKAASSDTGDQCLATKGWVNDPTTSKNVVHRSGDEIINGNKTFNNLIETTSPYIILKNNDIDCTTKPTQELESYVRIIDKNDTLIGAFWTGQQTDGTIYSQIVAFNKNGNYNNIAVFINQDGKIRTQAPTPTENEPGTQIATIEYVKQKIASGFIPDNTYEELELTSSGQIITSPGNGYFCYRGISNTNAGCYMLNTVNGLGSQSIPWQQGGGIVLCSLPVKTGDTIQVVYGGNKTYLRFIPFKAII